MSFVIRAQIDLCGARGGITFQRIATAPFCSYS